MWAVVAIDGPASITDGVFSAEDLTAVGAGIAGGSAVMVAFFAAIPYSGQNEGVLRMRGLDRLLWSVMIAGGVVVMAAGGLWWLWTLAT